MNTKKTKPLSPLVILGIVLIIGYVAIRIASLAEVSGGMSLDVITIATDNIFDFSQPLIFNETTLGFTALITVFCYAIILSFSMDHHKNRQEDTHGSAEWGESKSLDKLKDKKNPENNIIFTKGIQISKDMRKTDKSRHILLLGRPGSGKSRSVYIGNILNATGSFACTDPKGELLGACGHSLTAKGYTIKVLNLNEKFASNGYNPLNYIRRVATRAYDDTKGFFTEDILKEDDVMTLINIIFKNTKSESIQNQSGDPFWEKAEMVFLQAIFYYVLGVLPEKQRNFKSIMKLISLAAPDENGKSKLDEMFENWRLTDPKNIGILQYDLYKQSRGKMTNTIIMTAAARLAPFNISEVSKMTEQDDMELDRLGKPGDEGKIAWFIITKPNDSTFNFLANIFYTQMFNMVDQNASKFNGWLPTAMDFYMDEWAQLGEVPLFLENLAYVRGLNCGVVIGLQSLEQLKRVYKDYWETALDCCDYFFYLGSRSNATNKYVSEMLGKKTWYKKSQSRQYGSRGHSSHSWDVVGRELVTVDELLGMVKRHGILFIAGEKHPFYEEVYDLKTHPSYDELYEPREHDRTKNNLHDHIKYLSDQSQRNKEKLDYQNMGIKCEVLDVIHTQSISPSQLKKLKYQVVSEETLDQQT